MSEHPFKKEWMISKHPFTKAWEDWIASDEGKRCSNIPTMENEYLVELLKRLYQAFCAGRDAGIEIEHSGAIEEHWRQMTLAGRIDATTATPKARAEAAQGD